MASVRRELRNISARLSALLNSRPYKFSVAARALKESRGFGGKLRWLGKCVKTLLSAKGQFQIGPEDPLNAEIANIKEIITRLDGGNGAKREDRRNGNGPRICILTLNAVHGGVESLVAMEADYFKADVIVAGGLDDPYGSCPFEYDYADNAASLLAKLEGYDAVIYHFIPDWAVQAVKQSGIFSIEFVHRTDTSSCDKGVPNVVASHSQYVLDYVAKTYGRTDRLFLVPNGIDSERFAPSPSRLKKNIIGAVTSYTRIKGVDVIIDAWEKVLPRYKESYGLTLHGAGPELEALKKRARGEDIRLLGALTRPEELYRELFLYVTAARVEGLPLSVLEAMSCNIPVIASDIEGHRVINKMAQEAGFAPPLTLVWAGNAKAFAAAIMDFIDNPAEVNTRDIVLKLFSKERHCEGLLELIKRFG